LEAALPFWPAMLWKLDKIISVGEDFYRFSAYALLHFETLLDNYETVKNYSTLEARDVLKTIDTNLIDLLKKIGENNLTITSADIFYNISGNRGFCIDPKL
jgi:hypothetical protein